MNSYLVFKVLHALGAFYLFAALGAVVVGRLRAGEAAPPKDRASKLSGMTHGIALLLILVAGFGVLGIQRLEFGLWVWLKLAIWLLLAASIAVVRRSQRWAPLLWWLLPLLGAAAVWLCLVKPA